MCAEWSEFMVEIGGIHQLNIMKQGITPTGGANPHSEDKDGKRWPAFLFYLDPVKMANSPNGDDEPTTKGLTASCQGGTTTRVSWAGHCVAKFKHNQIDYYYDPSYGTGRFTGLLGLNNSFPGFAALGDKWFWEPDGKHLNIKKDN